MTRTASSTASRVASGHARVRVRGAVRCAIAGLAVAVLLGAGRASAGGPERFVFEPTEMRHEIGRAWCVTLPPGWEAFSDDVDHPGRSTAVLLEDGRPLTPAHAIHDTIRERGGGAWSHWLDVVYFSTSDGSDPRTNGKEYAIDPGRRVPATTRVPTIGQATTR